MECIELLTVEDTFLLNGNSVARLVLHPDFSVPKDGWKDRTEVVTIVRPDGERLEATAKFSVSHFNIRDPEAPMDRRWRVTIWLSDRAKSEVSIGSVVMVPTEIRDALLNPTK